MTATRTVFHDKFYHKILAAKLKLKFLLHVLYKLILPQNVDRFASCLDQACLIFYFLTLKKSKISYFFLEMIKVVSIGLFNSHFLCFGTMEYMTPVS